MNEAGEINQQIFYKKTVEGIVSLDGFFAIYIKSKEKTVSTHSFQVAFLFRKS